MNRATNEPRFQPLWNRWDGALTQRARFRFVAEAAARRIASLPERLRSRFGIRHEAVGAMDPSAIAVPDSLASRRAVEHARALSEPWLFNHCLRTYAWAALLAQARGAKGANVVRFDRELLLVACALHDLGLTDAHAGHVPDCACFAIEGAHAAHRFATDAIGWERERCDRLADAIALHLNVSVATKHGPEAHLLNAGAALDVVGLRLCEIPAPSRAAVLATYPRSDFVPSMVSAMKTQARMRPRSRASVLVGLGFCGMIRADPLGKQDG